MQKINIMGETKKWKVKARCGTQSYQWPAALHEAIV